jgi:hypothetical protein
MPHYLLSTYLPDNFDPSTMSQATAAGIQELNNDMDAAGVTKYACGLGSARTLRAQDNGEILLTDGPYLEAREHVGGLMILECANLDEVMSWARRSAKLCGPTMPTEVPEIFFVPASEKP